MYDLGQIATANNEKFHQIISAEESKPVEEYETKEVIIKHLHTL